MSEGRVETVDEGKSGCKWGKIPGKIEGQERSERDRGFVLMWRRAGNFAQM